MSRIRPSTLAILLPVALFLLAWEWRDPLYAIGQAAARQHAALSAECSPD